MSATKVGELEVELRLDNSNFEKNVVAARRRADELRASFDSMTRDLAANALKWGGIAVAIGATTSAISNAIARADELGKTAQKIGMPVEELSKLSYAAELADVELTTLSGALKILGKNLTDIAGGDTKSDAARTLKALGVSAVDAAGQMKPLNDVVLELADKFSVLRDSEAKTTLAINLAGRRMGPELIPLLNSGSTAIRNLGDELQRVGGVVTENAAKKAERYEDNLKRLKVAAEGLAMKMANTLLPSLVSVTDGMNKFVEKYQEWGSGENGKNTFEGSMKYWGLWNESMGKGSEMHEAQKKLEKQLQEGRDAAFQQKLNDPNSDVGKEFLRLKQIKESLASHGDGKNDAPIVESSEVTSEREQKLKELESKFKQMYEQLKDEAKRVHEDLLQPLDALAEKKEQLIKLSKAGLLSEQEFAKASSMAAWTMQSAYASAASAVAGALSNVFSNNKAVAIASALISTYEAAAKALAAPPGPPISYAYVAAALANGFAQVQAIRNTNKDSASAAPSVSATAPAATETPCQQNSGTLYVQGFNSAQFFSGDSVRELSEKLLQYQRDGGKVVLA